MATKNVAVGISPNRSATPVQRENTAGSKDKEKFAASVAAAGDGSEARPVNAIADSTRMPQPLKLVAPRGVAHARAVTQPKTAHVPVIAPTGQIKDHKSWLFVNIMAADNNLTKYMLGNLDDQERVGSDLNTHVVAYIDVGHEPNPMDHTWHGARSYYINKDDTPNEIKSELIEDYGDDVDMSDPETLRVFIADAIRKYPATNIALVLNDHGGGFTGAMADDTDGGFMTTPQLARAIAGAEVDTGKKISILIFDACLEGEAEVAYENRNNAEIMLASEETINGPGLPYSAILGRAIAEAISRTQKALEQPDEAKINVGPRDFAKTVVDITREHQNDLPTFAALDLAEFDTLPPKINALAEAIKNASDQVSLRQKLYDQVARLAAKIFQVVGPGTGESQANAREGVRQAIKESENYGGGYTPYRDIRDLRDLCEHLKQSKDPKVKHAAVDLIAEVDSLVIANESSASKHPHSHGLSIYAPILKSDKIGEGYDDLAFAKDTEWSKALLSLKTTGTPAEPGTPARVWPDGSPKKDRPQAK